MMKNCTVKKQLKKQRSNRRAGFTLVELLVVIAIIGILASMMLPAIKSARESARASQCGSNARNLAMAANSHASQNREQLPALTGGPKGSGLVELMPYLELGNLYDSLGGGAGGINSTVPIYMCPSAVDQATAGRTHYTMCVGTRIDYATNPGGQGGDGADSWTADGGGDGSGTDPTGFGADGAGAFGTGVTSMASMARDGASNTVLYSEKSDSGLINGGDMNQIAFHSGNQPNSNRDSSSFSPLSETHAHSNHPGGVSAAFGDGHVEFINNNISIGLWKALSTANGGEAWGLAGSQ